MENNCFLTHISTFNVPLEFVQKLKYFSKTVAHFHFVNVTFKIGTSAGPIHRKMEETIRGVIEAVIIRESNPRCQISLTIQPFDNNFGLAPLINCCVLGELIFYINILSTA